MHHDRCGKQSSSGKREGGNHATERGAKPRAGDTPAVDIFETDKEITVLADMPGVKGRELNIDLHNIAHP